MPANIYAPEVDASAGGRKILVYVLYWLVNERLLGKSRLPSIERDSVTEVAACNLAA